MYVERERAPLRSCKARIACGVDGAYRVGVWEELITSPSGRLRLDIFSGVGFAISGNIDIIETDLFRLLGSHGI